MGRSPYLEEKRKILFAHLEKFPESGSHTVAKILYRDFPEFFTSREEARLCVRRYRGKAGNQHREVIRITKYYQNV
jgi:hypothetical protein